VINSSIFPPDIVPLLLAAGVAVFLSWLWLVRRKKFNRDRIA